MRAYSGRVQLHHNICNDGDHLCTWEPLTLAPAARMLSSHLCPGISVVSSLVISSLLTTWWAAFWRCSVGDSGYEYSHVTQVVISVLLAPDLSWCEVAWVSRTLALLGCGRGQATELRRLYLLHHGAACLSNRVLQFKIWLWQIQMFGVGAY